MAEQAHADEIRRTKDGREWRIGTEREVAWIQDHTEHGIEVTCAIPAIFEAYATLELPGTSENARLDREGRAMVIDSTELRDPSVLSVLVAHTTDQEWWLGFLDTGSDDTVFEDAPKIQMYAHWSYVLVEAGPKQALGWRRAGLQGALPNLIFPADHSWLFTTLWDDDWSYIGGPRKLIDGFLAHPELGARTREVDPSMEDATPPGHIAF
jgi:hypothetical protein